MPMCVETILVWLEQNVSLQDICGKRVLEVGSYDVNGSIRPILTRLHPQTYVGVDMRPGSGVDTVCRAEDLVACFGPHSFDVIVSSCTLEHVRNWKEAISNIKHVCVPGGLILIIVPSRWPYHAYPHDYWRYDLQDMDTIFSDTDVLVLEEAVQDAMHAIVYLKAQKPECLAEYDLTYYEAHSVVAGKRLPHLHMRDFLSRHFA